MSGMMYIQTYQPLVQIVIACIHQLRKQVLNGTAFILTLVKRVLNGTVFILMCQKRVLNGIQYTQT